MHDARPNLILPESFYARDTVTVARDLLGKMLVRGATAAPIVEVEAYLGSDDRAAHASRGVTPRTRVIFGPPGRAYVYLIYGMHECLNIVAEPDGTAGCVLIRGVAGVSGPGRLTRAFGISRVQNGVPVFVPGGEIEVRDTGLRPAEIQVTPRIGIRHCADWPLRFVAAHLLPSSRYAEIHDIPRIRYPRNRRTGPDE
ncbi:MAG TPA: DNA-3-methyladenine glycosylase [Bryobacteraceae bacterium]|nr:DNA-3-methyladenine glycosylase [Bryobacteraceae bacterium]